MVVQVKTDPHPFVLVETRASPISLAAYVSSENQLVSKLLQVQQTSWTVIGTDWPRCKHKVRSEETGRKGAGPEGQADHVSAAIIGPQPRVEALILARQDSPCTSLHLKDLELLRTKIKNQIHERGPRVKVTRMAHLFINDQKRESLLDKRKGTPILVNKILNRAHPNSHLITQQNKIT